MSSLGQRLMQQRKHQNRSSGEVKRTPGRWESIASGNYYA